MNILKLVRCPVNRALQIEDIIELPSILPALYGTSRKPLKVSREEVECYLSTIKDLRKSYAALPQKLRGEAIDRVIP